MTNFAILSSIIFWPLAGILIISFIDNNDKNALRIKITALWTSLFPLIMSLISWYQFDNSKDEYQFVEFIPWFEGLGISYHLGVDGISIFFIVLTALLIPLCILASWNSITFRVKEYMIFFLLLESLVMGVFAALDLILFYLFFEAVLIPMYFIIGIWGGKDRVYASFKFFLYTLIGSLFMLLAVIYIYHFSCSVECTTSIPELVKLVPNLSLDVQKWLWLAFFVSFAVKVPMWPVHTWLPDAHVQAPTAGSVILAGVLLKLGGYGFIRLSLSLFPDAS
ncbi:MAG: NADH-quinone oxidoreductase subunit M, partial [Rickettsiales bacterium]|nr:NADH-quinone oxidoreductase subunit M [Rickettsiales bacterium]